MQSAIGASRPGMRAIHRFASALQRLVRQDGASTVHVEFMDPKAVLERVGKPEIAQLASEVRHRLERVMQAL